MRDIIWTLIIIWLIYKLIDVFKAITVKKSYVNNQHSTTQQQRASYTSNTSPKKDVKSAIQKHLNNDGEYVDFEEVK